MRFGKLFGASVWAKTLIVLITATGVGLEHCLLRGIAGVQQAAIMGVVFGPIYALTGRIRLLSIAHAASDLIAGAVIYWDLEEAVAHVTFSQVTTPSGISGGVNCPIVNRQLSNCFTQAIKPAIGKGLSKNFTSFSVRKLLISGSVE